MFLPFWSVKLTAHNCKKAVTAELETALSVVTTAYLRTEDIQTAVEENLQYLRPPVQGVFQTFLTRIKCIDPDVDAAIRVMDGVRVTIVNAETQKPAATSIDLSNYSYAEKTHFHFGKVSKVLYTGGQSLSLHTSKYIFYKPSQALPRIIYSSQYGKASIAEIKSYFTDEQVLRSICNLTGFDYDTLIGGDYKLVIEPIAYLSYLGNKYAMDSLELTVKVAASCKPAEVTEFLSLSLTAIIFMLAINRLV